jgi:hypothetical protein
MPVMLCHCVGRSSETAYGYLRTANQLRSRVHRNKSYDLGGITF